MIVFTLPTHLSLPVLTDISITQSTQVGVTINVHVKVVSAEEWASSHHYTITIVSIGHTVAQYNGNCRLIIFAKSNIVYPRSTYTTGVVVLVVTGIILFWQPLTPRYYWYFRQLITKFLRGHDCQDWQGCIKSTAA